MNVQGLYRSGKPREVAAFEENSGSGTVFEVEILLEQVMEISQDFKLKL